jgi:branched-chain amino acid transport system permease protein
VVWLGVPFPVAIAAGVLAGGILAIVVDQIGFQPLRAKKAGLLGGLITSIAFWIILDSLAGFATEQQSLAFPASTYPNRMVAIGPVMVPEMQIITILALIVCAVGIYLLIQKTRIGAAMRAVGWNEVAAGLGGVNARLVILLTAFLAGATSGLAGVLGGIATSNVSFTLGEGLMLKGFAAVVVGGFDDVRGTAIAGICLGIIEVFVGQYVSTAMRDGVTYALLLLFLIVRPRGLFGSASFQRA